MPKERNYNPVQAQRKADKAKAIKKGTWGPISRAYSYIQTVTDFCIQERLQYNHNETKSSRAAIPTESKSRLMT